jgi:hypothetical protein
MVKEAEYHLNGGRCGGCGGCGCCGCEQDSCLLKDGVVVPPSLHLDYVN